MTPNSNSATLLDLVLEAERNRGDNAALLEIGREPCSYRDLGALVRRTVGDLRQRGVSPTSRLALAMPQGAVTAACFLATASGAACASLSPGLSEQEAILALDHLRPDGVLLPPAGVDGIRAAAAKRGVPILEVRDDRSGVAGAFVLDGDTVGGRAADGVKGGADLALVLQTSATTAQPKLVPLTDGNILAAARATCAAHSLNIDDRRLNFMPLFHIQGLVGAVVATLASGSSIVCTTGFCDETLADLLDMFAPTWLSATPTMHQEILHLARRSGPWPSLRFVRAGSSALAPSLMHDLEDVLGVPVVESYGMTEAHQIACNPLPPGVRKPGSVGLPTGSEIAFFDDGVTAPEPGEVGEIVIRGANVMSGYLDDRAANEASFVDGWFRTGDVGNFDDDGYLYIVGRVKEVISRGGEKVAPREIDEVLLQHPAVAEAAAFGVPHPTLGQEVVSAVVLHREASVSEAELRDFAAARLSAFKVPRSVRLCEALPKGPTGKVQRGALADVHSDLVPVRDEVAQPDDEAEASAGLSALEAALAAVWCHLLRLPIVEIDDDFFFLGGDSLIGTRLLRTVRQVFGVDLPAMSVYDDASTVRSMAALIDALQRESIAIGR